MIADIYLYRFKKNASIGTRKLLSTQPHYLQSCCFIPLTVYTDKISPWYLSFHGLCGTATMLSSESGQYESVKEVALPFYYNIGTQIKQSPITGFTRLYHLDILPAFHQRNHSKLSLKMTQWLSYKGNTSICMDFDYTDALTGEPIAKAVAHNVTVDVATRRPCRNPAFDIVSRDQLTRKAPPRGFKQPMTPANSVIYTTNVVSSGTDSNQHQSMALHIRDCWNAGSMAACDGKLLHYDKDLAFYRVKYVTILYLGEVLIGDELSVACWEHDQDYDTLCFTMIKRSKVVGQCQMTFDSGDMIKSRTGHTLAKL